MPLFISIGDDVKKEVAILKSKLGIAVQLGVGSGNASDSLRGAISAVAA